MLAKYIRQGGGCGGREGAKGEGVKRERRGEGGGFPGEGRHRLGERGGRCPSSSKLVIGVGGDFSEVCEVALLFRGPHRFQIGGTRLLEGVGWRSLGVDIEDEPVGFSA